MTVVTDIQDPATNDWLCPSGFVRGRFRGMNAYYREDVTSEQLETLMSHEGEVVKQTRKVCVRSVGHWIIKSRRSAMAGALLFPKRNEARHVCGWCAGNYFRACGIRVPEPLAYMEYGIAGIITRSWHIFENLFECRDVEGADELRLSSFLYHLAVAINSLADNGAYHGDLSGKNIFTRDGVRFYLIDLDAVELNVPYDEERRLKNHVQLYDSFCDALSWSLSWNCCCRSLRICAPGCLECV